MNDPITPHPDTTGRTMAKQTFRTTNEKAGRSRAVTDQRLSGCHPEGNGQWAMGNGQWAMGNGQWAMGNGQWAMGNGQWAMGNGQWAMGNGQPIIPLARANGNIAH
ncbi:hypothetical protein [Edwardsiella tarda]|uniref:hypothetical protein n=1 Tax=Edwardsiella tarda TaxID=636 RepID=UPI00285255C6|nr:hypothetical protein [Edwardsiella tarda]